MALRQWAAQVRMLMSWTVHSLTPFAGLGFVLGPSIGSGVWRMTTKHDMKLFDIKDRDFFNRVARNRVDAELQSMNNPVPDYYCES